MQRSHFKLSKYKSMYFHCLNSGLKLKTKHFQINAFLSQRIIVFSWFHFCRIPNTIINIGHKLYIFSRLLFLLFSIFSPQNKMSRTTLIFFDFNKTEKLATFTRLREAIGVQSTTPDWEQYRKNLLFWVWLQSWPSQCYKLRGQARKGQFIPCDWSSSPALPQGLGHPCFLGTAQRPPTQLRHKERSLGIYSMVPKVRPLLPLAWQWQKSPRFCLLWHVEW